MLNRFASLRLVAWFVVVASPALVRAQALADRVPADTILYIGWRGADTPGSGFEGSHLQAVLADSNLPRVFDDLLPRVLDRIGQENREAAEVVEVVRTLMGPMWRHPTAIAFVGLDMERHKDPKPKLVLLCQAGQEAGAVKFKIDQLLEKAGAGGAPFPIHAINRNGLVAVVVGYENPADAIPDGAEGKSLANNPHFIKSLEQVGKNGFITVYVDIEKGVSLIESAMQNSAPPEFQQNYAIIRDKLGLKGIKRAIWTSGFDGKDWSSRLFIAAPAPRAGLLGSFIEGKPLSEHILGSIPENAAVAGAFHFDIAGLVDAVRAGIAAIDPHAGRKVDEAIDHANQTVGIDIQKDLLGALGDEWAYYNDPAVAGNGVVGSTLVNHLNDPAKAEASLTKLEDFFNLTVAEQMRHEKVTISFRRTTIGQTTVHYLAIPLVTPAWAVQNGNLYIALYPEVVGAAVAQVPGRSKSIVTNPAFAALMHRLGNHPASSFGFADLPKLAPENYSIWLVLSHLANAADLFGIPAPVMILPPLDKLMAHLSAAGDVSWTDAEGLHAIGLTPFPGSEIFAANPTNFILGEAFVGFAMMRPLMNRGRFIVEHAITASHPRSVQTSGKPKTKD